MKKKTNFKLYSTAFVASLLLGTVSARQVESYNNLDQFKLLTIANASSDIRYVNLKDTSSRLNFRKEPTTNSKTKNGSSNILGKLEHGDVVHVSLSATANANGINWIKVKVNGKIGWVDRSKLATSSPKITIGTPISGTTKKQVSTSNGSNLNVRTSAATKENNIVGTLKNGEIVEVTNETKQWYQIKKDSLTGWVNKSYLKDIPKEDAYNTANTWSHKDAESDIHIKKIHAYGSDVYIANIKIQNALQFKHVYSDENLSGTKKTVTEMTKNYSPLLAINSNGFSKEGLPCGTIGARGKIDQFISNKTSLAMDYNGMLHIVRPKTQEELESIKPFWVTTFGPSLIEDYKIVQKQSDNDVPHPRVAIAQKDKPNEFIIIVADGRRLTSKGLTLYELASLFKKEGARIAYNLDGGGSATLVFKGKIINKPSDILGPRKVVDSLFIRNIK